MAYVYLVSQNDIGKHWSFDKLEVAVLVEYLGASDVGWHKVGGKLNAVERESECVGEGVDHEGLCKARHSHQQAVPSSED